MLNQTSASIQLSNDIQTHWFASNFGVRQGDNLSPTLFSLFINDLVNHLKDKCLVLSVGNVDLNCLLYADDMVLIAETEQALQSLLDELYNWCFKWRIKVNESKSKVVHFRKPSICVTDVDFKYSNAILDKVPSYKYLGVIFDEYTKFDFCTKALADSGGRALGAIISKFKSLKNVGYKTFEVMYNSGVKPVLEYGSGVWGHVNGNCINSIQNRAMRFYLGVHKFSPNLALCGDLGWLTPKLSRYIGRVRLWNRLLAMDEGRLTRKIFEWDYDLSKANWSSGMKSLFKELGSEVFDQKVGYDMSNIIEPLKKLMLDRWKKEVVKKPKLRTYIKFKHDIETESYVKQNMSRQARSLFAQFRHGILPLKIETGRFKNLDVEERVCELCQLGVVESEIHFLCKCPLYDNIRAALFAKCNEATPNFLTLDDDAKFVHLMNYKWRDVSNFIVNAWKLRQETLYK